MPEVPAPAPGRHVIDTILVPLDGSEAAARVLPVAAELADRLDAEIRLVAVADHGRGVAELRAALDSAPIRAERVRREVLTEADPAQALAEHLRTLEHPAVCMASHGRGRSAAVLGSVAADLVSAVRVPVVLAGPGLGDVAPWMREPHRRSGVVACVDEVVDSAAALVAVAFAWGELLSEPVEIVTVAEPVPSPIEPRPARRRFGPEGDPEAFLDSLVAPIRASGGAIAPHVLWDPISPADGLRDHLRGNPPVLVVVGTRGRHGIARMLAGSVAAGIVRISPAPVLVVAQAESG
jgi:nucleotide-binding universal stress UspA family protein